MSTYSKQLLSGSTDGNPIKIAATTTPGTAIHTAITGTQGVDEIVLFFTNTHTVPVTITIEWGGVTDPDDLLVKNLALPPNSAPIPVATGQIVQDGASIAAFASVADVVVVTGYVNRIL